MSRLERVEREDEEKDLQTGQHIAACLLKSFGGSVAKARPEEMAQLTLLAAVWLGQRNLIDGLAFGKNYFRIRPVALDTTPVVILEKETRGLVRKVTLIIDSAVGGPTPTIRVGDGSVSANGGGFRVSAGATNEIGEVEPDKVLQAVSSVAIGAYVIERA